MFRRNSALASCVLAILFASASAQTDAPTDQVRRYRLHHVWGRFHPGTWKLVRVHTESFDISGEVAATSVAERRFTLADVNKDGVKLRVESTVEVGGKKLDAPPQELTEGFTKVSGRSPGAPLNTEVLTISDRKYECRVEEVEARSATVRQITRTWTCDELPPFVMKRETRTFDLSSGQPIDENTMQVVGLTTRRTILARLRVTAEIREETRTLKGSVVTRGWQCPDVPGGVIRQETEEFDPSHQLIRRSRIELVDYSIVH